MTASAAANSSAVTPMKWPMVRWRNCRMASRPASSSGAIATSHSVSKPSDRLFRLVEPIRSSSSSIDRHLGVDDDPLVALRVGAEGEEAVVAVGAAPAGTGPRPGPCPWSCCRTSWDCARSRPARSPGPSSSPAARASAVGDHRRGEILVLHIDQPLARAGSPPDAAPRSRAPRRGRRSRARCGRCRRACRAGRRLDALGPGIAVDRRPAPSAPRWPGTSARAPDRPAPARPARPSRTWPRAAADGITPDGWQRRGSPSRCSARSPSGRWRCRPPPQKATASSMMTTFW